MSRMCRQCNKQEMPVERLSWATPVCYTCLRMRPWEQTRSAPCEPFDQATWNAKE
jgi:hypothetical protein